MNALDSDNALTCWNSEGSTKGKTSSFIIIDFGRVVQPVQAAIQFQAGFVAADLAVSYNMKGGNNSTNAGVDDEWVPIVQLEVDDDHEMQQFSLIPDGDDMADSLKTTRTIKLFFDECTDFYGRIIVYKLQIWGRELHPGNAAQNIVRDIGC
jgi:hypothetical protein